MMPNTNCNSLGGFVARGSASCDVQEYSRLSTEEGKVYRSKKED